MDKSSTWTRVDPKFCADKWRYFLNWRHNDMCARNGWSNLHLNYVSIYNFVKKLKYIINLKYITMTKKFKLKTAKKRVFFLKRSYKIIPFNNNNAICQRNIIEQLSNMNFQFPGCSVFWDRGFKHRLNEVASISLVLNGYALCVYNNLYS